VESARSALAAGNLPAARAKAEGLKKSRFADDKLAVLEKELAVEESLIAYRAALKDALALVSRDQLDKARDGFERARALNPDDRAAAAGLAALKRMQEVQNGLKRADQHLAEQRFDQARIELLKGLDGLLQEANAPLWREQPFKSRLDALLKEGALVCRQVCVGFTASSDKARRDADQMLTLGKYPEALAQYEKALDLMQQAKSGLGDLRRIDGDAAVDPTEAKDVDLQLGVLRQAGSKVKSRALLADGTKGLDLAKLAMQQAAADPTLVDPALKALDAALKLLRDAEALEGKVAADPIREAEALKGHLTRLLHPVALDLTADPAAPEWFLKRDQWTRKTGGDGTRWLQAVPLEAVQMRSASSVWPVDFELVIEFALVDARGKINNTLWPYYADPVTLGLDQAGGGSTKIVLGADDSVKGQRLARLRVNKKEYTVGGKDLVSAEPIRLVVQRKKGVVDVRMDQRKICSLPIANEFRGVTLHIDNPDKELLGQRWSVAIYRLDVTWIGVDEKAKSP
jgi:tetratricopeptide (TPR) repeat protein